MRNKGQVTIFIIIAIIIVSAVIGFFVLRDTISFKMIPSSVEPVYTTFQSCLEEEVLIGVNVLESQGGYIELPGFKAGSYYSPFSSQLNFLGNEIPYWYYLSASNLEKEQVPSKKDMGEQLEKFVEENIRECVFDEYYEQGFEIDMGEPEAQIVILDKKINLNLDMDLSISNEKDKVLVENHDISVDSNLGNLYDSAKEIYEEEQENLFLENYAVDNLRLYAPVDGTELSCSPEIWNADNVFSDLQEAIEFNTLSLKTQGNENDYFVIDTSVDNTRFINSKNWPSYFEVVPSDGNMLIAEPIGNQEGLGILGFCYVPYHFVYDLKYPVLVQVYEGEEIFQFPLVVSIEKNKPRKPLNASAGNVKESEVCKYQTTPVEIRTYDRNLNSIESKITYECLGETCYIGETSSGVLENNFPQCVNGYIVVKSNGFKETKHLYSTTQSGSVDIILDKLYEMELELSLDGASYNGEAMVTFISGDDSKTIIYPEQNSIELSEGQYEIQVYIYEESSLNLESTTSEQCVDVSSGLGGVFGITEEKCFEMEIPSQIVSSALSGGGKENYYILENELIDSNIIKINAESLPKPKTIEQLQDNYLLFENKELGIVFR